MSLINQTKMLSRCLPWTTHTLIFSATTDHFCAPLICTSFFSCSSSCAKRKHREEDRQHSLLLLQLPAYHMATADRETASCMYCAS